MIITQHATESLTTLNRRGRKGNDVCRLQQLIAHPLVIALTEIKRAGFAKGMPKRSFTNQDQAFKTLFFYRSNKPFSVGITSRRPWRTSYRLDAFSIEDVFERLGELRVFIRNKKKVRKRVRPEQQLRSAKLQILPSIRKRQGQVNCTLDTGPANG